MLGVCCIAQQKLCQRDKMPGNCAMGCTALHRQLISCIPLHTLVVLWDILLHHILVHCSERVGGQDFSTKFESEQ